MAHEVISTCPVCQHDLEVTRLRCRECGTTLEGEFTVGRFARLDRDQMRILESFLRSRGNLRDMERELGLSYPTVRGRVDTLVRALGLGGAVAADEPPAKDGDAATERRRILARLAKREIDATEAALALRRLGDASPTGAKQEVSGDGEP